MALLFADGFDNYATAGSSGMGAAGWTQNTVQAVDTTGGRFGGGCWFSDATNVRYIEKDISANASGTGTVIVNFAFKRVLDAAGTAGVDPLVTFYNPVAGDHATLQLGDRGGMSVLFADASVQEIDGPGFLNDDRWHYFEVKLIVSNTGSMQIKVDDLDLGTFSGDTLDGATAEVHAVRFTATPFPTSIDDILIMDGTGSEMSDFIGDMKIETLVPDADGTAANWATGGTGTNNYDRVDDANGTDTDDDTTYLSSATTDQDNFVSYPNMQSSPAPNTIEAVVNTSRVREESASTSNIALINRGGTTNDVSSDFDTPLTTYTWEQYVSHLNPDVSSAWTETTVNSAETGIRYRS